MTERPSRAKHLVIALGVIAVIGVSVSGILAWRTFTIERAEPDQALSRFTTERDNFRGTDPMLRVDSGGSVIRRAAPENEPVPPGHLRVLAYRHSERRLVQAVVPLWFLKVKGPGLQYSLRGTGLDLERLGVTAADLQRYGPCLVLDETRANGDRLLVWTE